MSVPLLEAVGLTKRFPRARASLVSAPGWLTAVDDVSFTLEAGRSVAIVGESGSGKSTLARMIVGLERPDAGAVRVMGQAFVPLTEGQRRPLRRHVQMVFQDPASSLDPRLTIGAIVDEPLRGLTGAGAAERRARTVAALAAVGLSAEMMALHPHQFSGGQRQRIAIARALVTEPAAVVADEPLSALDASVQAQVLNVMIGLKRAGKATFILITHDLAAAAHLCEEALVMQAGVVVERGPLRAVFDAPKHPYTQALIAARRALD